MNDSDGLPFGWAETLFLSDIYHEGALIAENVKSKLMTNRLTYDAPSLTLLPSEHDWTKLTSKFLELEIKGHTKLIGGETAGEIHIPKGYVIHAHEESLGPSWREYIVKIEPSELYQKHYVRGPSDEERKATITFFLTQNEAVTPLAWVEQSFTGDVKHHATPRAILEFKGGWQGRFERNHSYAKTEVEKVKGTFSASQLVLTIEKRNHCFTSLNEVHEMSDIVDDCLRYLSFASRQPVTWVKWVTVIEGTVTEYFREVYRPTASHGKELIDLSLIQEFLQHCIEYMNDTTNLNLYVPLLQLWSLERFETVDTQFLTLYTGLEALLQVYGKRDGRGKHFRDEDAWKNFYAEIRNTIEGSRHLADDDRPVMLGKLGIFNQTSTKALYQDFCDALRVDTSDLWPLFGGHRPLSDIRNKLVHGERLESGVLIYVAGQHLRWIVERCLLAVLGWKKPTKIDGPDGLTRYTAYKDWKQHIEK